MDFLIDNWPLVLAAVVSGTMLLWPAITREAAKLTPNEAVPLINREKAVLIDVSDPPQYAARHAAGAKSVPLAELEKTTNLPKNKNLPLVVMCPNGARASRAVNTLRKLGFVNAQALSGGLAAWSNANLPVEKSA